MDLLTSVLYIVSGPILFGLIGAMVAGLIILGARS